MLENAVSDIPRFYTALAEWLSCNLFVLLLGPKIKYKQSRDSIEIINMKYCTTLLYKSK